MAQKALIARAAKGLLDILALLMRGVGALCAAFGSVLVFLVANAETDADDSDTGYGYGDNGRTISNEEREARNSGWSSW
jgi:hypothetical protein